MQKGIVIILLLVFILLGLLCAPGIVAQEDEYEYEDEEEVSAINQSVPVSVDAAGESEEYEYEYEDENDSGGSGLGSAEMHQGPSINFQAPPSEVLNGFIRHTGGGLMKIGRGLVDEIFINETVDKYDCVRMVDSMVQIVEVTNTTEEVMNVTAQIQDLKMKMDRVMQFAIKTQDDAVKGGGPSTGSASSGVKISPSNNETQSTNTTAVPDKPEPKRMSFREKQALRMQQRKEKALAREAVRPKYRLGADCETLVCGACKAVVDEFGQSIYNAIRNPQIKYVDQLMEGFCASKTVTLKYADIVADICTYFEQETLGYKEALVSAFEEVPRWEDVNKIPTLNKVKKQVCLAIGACEEEQFEFVNEPTYYTQEQWDDRCFTCQAFAKDLEERIDLARHLTERSIVPLVSETCDRLDLDPHYRQVCQPMTQGKLLDDIAWLAKMHGESVARKAKGELKFPDKLCEEIDWCQPWIDPEKLKEKEAQASMEAVFF